MRERKKEGRGGGAGYPIIFGMKLTEQFYELYAPPRGKNVTGTGESAATCFAHRSKHTSPLPLPPFLLLALSLSVPLFLFLSLISLRRGKNPSILAPIARARTYTRMCTRIWSHRRRRRRLRRRRLRADPEQGRPRRRRARRAL